MERFYNPSECEWGEILKRPLFVADELDDKVRKILTDIRNGGEQALRRYTEKFDGVIIDNLLVGKEEMDEAEYLVADELKNAIKAASLNISKFHQAQMPELIKVETSPGVLCWQKAVAIEKVGLYVPGGSAPLFSTVLMLAIPARIAGCRDVFLCTPPNKEGKVHPAILFAARLAGIDKIFKLGGIQAVAAMAFGVAEVPKADKIFGPGNQYVMAAKQLVGMVDVAIDMPAGPSEVAIMADFLANPAFVAADLLSQAEHGPDSQTVLITNDLSLPDKVERELELQLSQLPRKEIAAKALENSRAIVLDSIDAMIRMVNQYAPEHLIVSMENYNEVAGHIVNAGSVFLGNYAPESAGDYASGTNHTLPTNGWARSFSGANIDSFMKKITFQEISREGIKTLGPVIETMAAAEQLHGHKNAVTLRLNDIENNNK